VEVEPWFAVWSDDGTWPGQAERHADVVERCDAKLGDRVYLAEEASIACESLTIGERTYVAKGCVLRDRITLGDDCTLNPYVVMAGRITVGDGVRIASFAALYGFDHRFDDLETPIWLQPLDEVGIVVGDDVWIGTHAVICDGVTVGAHSVVAAGAVVTRDVPPWSVVAGAPARVLYDRRDRFGPGGDRRRVRAPRDPLSRFDERASEQWRDVLARCRTDHAHGQAAYVDSPGAPWKVRPTCDAVEISAAFGDAGAAGASGELVSWLQGLQDPGTGLFPDPTEPPLGDDPLALRLEAEFSQYGILSVGYALEVLGAGPAQPIRVIEELASDELLARLDALPWDGLAWPAGAWVDAYGTGVHLNARHHGSGRGLEALLGWLATRVDPLSGMWGPPDRTWGWLMPVNGFYRLTRGTYAQLGLPLPHPEAAVDTVAAHGRTFGWFTERERNACNVLDVVHPLWLAARQTDHRRAELRDQVAGMLADALGHWIDGEGFSFGTGRPTGLQGTEMWLSIIHLAADLLGESDGLSWAPRGVHRLEPAADGRHPLSG
jgi:acetyltransferase-like isoleucine patch superfamily enzyme